MDDGERDDLVAEVADALTLDQDVDWDRCRRQATPANRRSLDNLRLVAGMFSGSQAAESASAASAATNLQPFAGVFVRPAMQALMAFAAVEVAAALLLFLWGWGDIYREYGAFAVQLAFLLVGYSVTAGLFLFGGRRDRRTWLLGAYFLLKATMVNPFVFLGLLRGVPPTEPFGYPNFGYPYVYPFLFAPACLWAFARECPRVHRRTWLDDLARRMVVVSLVVGCVQSVASVAVLELTRADYVDRALFWLGFDALLATSILLALGAVVVVVLRAHTAPAEEARRVALFSAGFLMCTGLSALYHVLELFSPGSSLTHFRWTPVLVAAEPLRFPGVALLWCSVLAVRVPHLREAVRAAYQQMLARRGLLAGAAAIPAVALAGLVASRPDRTVGSMVADPLVQSLAAVAGVLLLVSANRERLLMRLDAWIYPETADQRQALADAAAALGKAERVETVSRTLSRTAERGCGSPVALLLPADAAAADLNAPDGKVAPLARASAIVHVLEAGDRSLRVHPNDKTSIFGLLPCDDRRWVAETDADVIVGVPGPGAELLGVLAAGRRFDGRIVRSVDIPFLEVLGAAAGLAVGRLMRAEEAGALDEAPAQECPVCRYLTRAGESPACNCGSEYVETEAPTLLAGKYRLTRRLGTGGTGAAFLARDLRLERDVAVKTLTGVSVLRLMGLKPEAWAMATVNHPAIAHVYGIESWRNRPFLVVEFLPGGTLADRLRRGPVPAARAVDIGALLADALAALHEAGYMHGDIKPSNVGFTSDGSPKLLDFGLARETSDAAATRGGTVRYLSPEVLSGRPADEADDVWSLCVMLHEIVSGEHPFAGNGVDEVTDRIRRQRLGRAARATAGPDASSALIAFTASMLAARRAARPATARAFADALRAVRRRQ